MSNKTQNAKTKGNAKKKSPASLSVQQKIDLETVNVTLCRASCNSDLSGTLWIKC